MGAAEIITLAMGLIKLATQLIAEKRLATAAEVDALMADVKARQASAESAWAALKPK